MADDDEHLHRNAWCKECWWIGEGGELIASGKPGRLRCPECGGDNTYIGKGKTHVERLENIKAAFAEHDIPWPFVN